MTTPREHVETHLRLSRDTLALIDATVTKAREEFDDPEIDRQQVLELLIEHRPKHLKRDGGMEETRFSLFRNRAIEDGFVEVPFRWPVEYYEEFRRLGVEIDRKRPLLPRPTYDNRGRVRHGGDAATGGESLRADGPGAGKYDAWMWGG